MALKIYSAYLDVCMYVCWKNIQFRLSSNLFLWEAVLPFLENYCFNKGQYFLSTKSRVNSDHVSGLLYTHDENQIHQGGECVHKLAKATLSTFRRTCNKQQTQNFIENLYWFLQDSTV